MSTEQLVKASQAALTAITRHLSRGAPGCSWVDIERDLTEALAAQPVAPVPMPGGIRLTVVERCELIDWRDKCVNDAVSRTLAAAQPQQATEARESLGWSAADESSFKEQR